RATRNALDLESDLALASNNQGPFAGLGERQQCAQHTPSLRCPLRPAQAALCCAGAPAAARIRSLARSAIMMVGALVLPPISLGITEASTTRRASMPRTRSSGSTTAWASLPIQQVPIGW